VEDEFWLGFGVKPLQATFEKHLVKPEEISLNAVSICRI
jgi:hypothetical protein